MKNLKTYMSKPIHARASGMRCKQTLPAELLTWDDDVRPLMASRIKLKYNIRLWGVLVNSSSITPFDRFSFVFGPAEEARGAGSLLRRRLARSPDPTGAPELAEVSRFLKEVSPRMVPGSTRNWIAVNAVKQSSLNKK
jgi:hypothetical protein